jgi:hemoglobin/transferrin/lactoferrin receptor protein
LSLRLTVVFALGFWGASQARVWAAPAVGQQPKQRPSETAEAPKEYTTVVTAGRRAEVVFDSARSASVVNRRELDERAVRTTPEALDAVPGVYVQHTNYGGGAPIIRGQLGNRILLLVDGIRLNNGTYRAGPNQFLNTVDPFAVDRVEVIRGLGSVGNGSDAIGGTVNVLTEAPVIGPEARSGAQLQLRAASADRSGVASGRVVSGNDRVGFVAVAGARHFGSLRTGGGVVQPFTGYDEWSGLVSGAWQPTPDKPGRRFSSSVQTTRQYDVPRSDRSFPTDFRLFSLQTRQLSYVRFEDTSPDRRLQRVRATLSWNRQGEVLDRYRLSRDVRIRDAATVDTFGAQLELDVASRMPSGMPVTVGFDAYVDRIATGANETVLSSGVVDPQPLAVRYPDGVGYASAGLFIIHDLVASARYRLTLEGRGGVVRVSLPQDSRLSAIDPTVAPLPALTENVPVYAAGVHGRRAIGDHLAAFAGGTLGFRAPNVDDYSRLGAEGPAFVVPTRGLDPERAWSGEVGMKGEWPRAQLSLAYAYTRISNALLRTPANLGALTTLDDLPIGRVRNVESATYHSAEVSAVVPIRGRLSFAALGAYTRGSVAAPVFSTAPAGPTVVVLQPASKVPPAFGRAALRWRGANGRWFSELALRFALAQTRLGEIDVTDARICPPVPGTCAGTPAWAELGLRAGFRWSNSIRLVGALENITDARYRVHASGIDAPGRSFTVMLEGYL